MHPVLAPLLCLLATPADGPLDPLAGLVGAWEGTLSYRDYQSDEHVELPARMRATRASRGRLLVADLEVSDPGRPVCSLEVVRWDDAAGTLTSDSYGRAGSEHEEWRVASREVASEREWTLVLEAPGQDDERPADFRMTRTLSGDRFESRTEVHLHGAAEDEWFERHSLALRRAPADPLALRGTWTVDLRPTPDAPAYEQPFVVTSVDGGTFEGTFYGSTLREGRLNTSWGAVHFSFVTDDGRGDYHTSGRLLPDGTLEGTTHSLGRHFLSVWTARR